MLAHLPMACPCHVIRLGPASCLQRCQATAIVKRKQPFTSARPLSLGQKRQGDSQSGNAASPAAPPASEAPATAGGAHDAPTVAPVSLARHKKTDGDAQPATATSMSASFGAGDAAGHSEAVPVPRAAPATYDNWPYTAFGALTPPAQPRPQPTGLQAAAECEG